MRPPISSYLTKKQLIEWMESLPDGVIACNCSLDLQAPDDDFCGSLYGGVPMKKFTENAELTFTIKASESEIYAALNHRNMQQLII